MSSRTFNRNKTKRRKARQAKTEPKLVMTPANGETFPPREYVWPGGSLPGEIDYAMSENHRLAMIESIIKATILGNRSVLIAAEKEGEKAK